MACTKKALCLSVSNISITYLLAHCFHNQTLAENKWPPLCSEAIRFSRYQLFEQVLGTVWSKSINRIKKIPEGRWAFTDKYQNCNLIEHTEAHSKDDKGKKNTEKTRNLQGIGLYFQICILDHSYSRKLIKLLSNYMSQLHNVKSPQKIIHCKSKI